ncbi:hypothetical protein QOZ80_2BG0195350 [Eleusine coracana subsp. coracana]|nr:hypothetical protein QOZ80_2BG0195350 [Eleusine coracana subsp. coracana]
MSPAGLFPSVLHSVMLNVCILVILLHIAGDGDLVCMMRASSCWSLATRSTRRLHGTKMSVTGMIQIPNVSISIAADFCEASEVSLGFLHHTAQACVFPIVACIYIYIYKNFFGRLALSGLSCLNYCLSS